MNQHASKLKTFMLAAAASLGLALPASAQDAATAAPPPPAQPAGWGLLGARYTSVAWNYIDHDSGAGLAHGFSLAYNQPLQQGFDFTLGYDSARSNTNGVGATDHLLDAGLTAFTVLDWGRPFVQGAAGWEWQRAAGSADDSFVFSVGTGVEFQVASDVLLTPYVSFVRSTGFNRSEVDYGVKATYRFNRDWSLTVRAQYDALRHTKDATEYSAGVNYRF